MFAGVARKIAFPFLILCGLGWACYVAGFILRNVRYSQRNGPLDHAAKPEFFFNWMFGVTGPAMIILGVLHVCAERQPLSIGSIIALPFFFISAGAVLFLNGLQIYEYYQFQDSSQNILLYDTYQSERRMTVQGQNPIHLLSDDVFIVVEFAGTLASIIFAWIFLLFSPFFALRGTHYEVY